MGVTKTHDEFVNELATINPDVLVIGTYHKSSEPIQCKCVKCGTIWNSRPNNLLRGCSCPTCGIKKRAKTQTKDSSTFLAELATINSNIEILEEYIGARKPIACRCRTCSFTWKASPTNLLRGKSCPKCSRIVAANKNRRTHDEFIEITHRYHPDIEPLEEYRSNTTKIKMRCNRCGHEWSTVPSVLVSGGGCPGCAGNKIYSQEEFVAKLRSINPFVEVLSEYRRSIIPIKCKCLRCGHIWDSQPNNLLNGTGCPACFHSTTSFLEQVILLVFQEILGENEVLHRDLSAIGKELDIYIPSLSLAIEPGSWRWHKEKIDIDRQKREKCSDIGIRLVTIYTDYFADEPPFAQNCICIKETLGFENDKYVLKDLIITLLSVAGFAFEFHQDEWNRIISNAYDKSRRITTDDFRRKVSDIHPRIAIVGEYTGAWNKITAECLECGHRWEPAANSLLQAHGCPKCASHKNGIKRRKTSVQFKLELKEINSHIELLSNYTASNERVSCQCIVCGHQWSSLPGNLLKGKGCPTCARKNSTEKRRKSSAQFLCEMAKVHPKIEIIGSYSSMSDKTSCKCLLCGNIWKATPANLLSGKGCPICADRKRSYTQMHRALQKSGALSKSNPSLAKEWHPTKNGDLAPTQVTPGSGLKVWWICSKCGHEWHAVIGSRNKGHGCPVCARKKTK